MINFMKLPVKHFHTIAKEIITPNDDENNKLEG